MYLNLFYTDIRITDKSSRPLWPIYCIFISISRPGNIARQLVADMWAEKCALLEAELEAQRLALEVRRQEMERLKKEAQEQKVDFVAFYALLTVCVYVCASVCLCVCVSVILSVCLSVCMYV